QIEGEDVGSFGDLSEPRHLRVPQPAVAVDVDGLDDEAGAVQSVVVGAKGYPGGRPDDQADAAQDLEGSPDPRKGRRGPRARVGAGSDPSVARAPGRRGLGLAARRIESFL